MSIMEDNSIKIFKVVLVLAIFQCIANGNNEVLYNTNTHETITPSEIAGGGTSWMLLDADNANYASYTHPAYYNTSLHQVLDSASGSKVGDWILTAGSSGSNSGSPVQVLIRKFYTIPVRMKL